MEGHICNFRVLEMRDSYIIALKLQCQCDYRAFQMRDNIVQRVCMSPGSGASNYRSTRQGIGAIGLAYEDMRLM